MFGFAIVISIVIGLMWFYAWKNLVAPLGLVGFWHSFALSAFVVAYFLQIARWLLFWVKDELSWLLNPAYFMLGFLSHLVLIAIIKDVVVWFSKPDTTGIIYANISVIAIALIANVWGSITAFSGPIIRTQKVLPSVHQSSPVDFRLVQISDLHVGPLIKKDYVEKVVEQVNSLNPDMVAITGDLGDGYVKYLLEDLAPLKNIKSRYGAYYVTGNHEYYWNATDWMAAVEDLGIHVLLNSGKLIEHNEQKIWVAGVPDEQGARFLPDHQINPEKALEQAPKDAYRIMLAHQPNSVKRFQNGDVQLILCGHTHWGQFFPYNYLVGWFNLYSKAMNKHHDSWVYVNAGTGFWGPPLRLGVPSEITLFNFR